MAKTAILSVKIIGDSKGAITELDKTESKLAGFGKKAGKLVAAGAVAAGAATAALGVAAVKSAGDLEQSIGAIDTVFKGSADQMHTWAKGAATDVGLTRNEFNELGTLIGTQLKNGGTAMDELAPKTNELIGLGADLSSMFGGTTADAVGALSSALKGERDPIEKFGVSLTQAAIDAKAAELGFTKVGGALSAEANQAATLALIMDQTADAHGNFAKESDTLAHKQQVFQASVSNLVTELGTALLPIATAVFGFLNDTAVPAVQAVVAAFTAAGEGGGLASKLGLDVLQPILAKVGTFLAGLIPIAQQFFFGTVVPAGQAIAANLIPVIQTIVDTVFPALVGAFRTIIPPAMNVISAVLSLAVAISGKVMPIVQALLPVVTTIFSAVSTVIGNAMNVISGIITTVMALISGDWSGAWEAIKSTASAAIDLVGSVIDGGLQIIGSLFTAAKETLTTIFGDAWEAIKETTTNGIDDVIDFISQLPQKALDALSGIGETLVGVGSDLIGGFLRGITNAAGRIKDTIVNSVTSKIPGWIKGPLGIASPSKVTAKIAQWIPKGIAKGIEDHSGKVKAAMRDVSGVVASTRLPAPTVPGPTGTGRRAHAASAAARPTVVININDALDPVAVARRIRQVLGDEAILMGRA